MTPRLRLLSLGAGVQSTTVALMAARGEFADALDGAIFADTGWEPKAVYQHLNWLKSMLPFPVHVVGQSMPIREGILARRNTMVGRFAAVPWFTVNPDGSKGMGRRQCSSEYKLTPIMWKVRELLGASRRSRLRAGEAEIWIGISRDEASRMKPARQRYMVNRWPLIEREMTRLDCLAWLSKHGYPEPPKSACIGCPFHNQAMWQEMRDKAPDEFADAVAVDAALRQGNSRGIRAQEYMHPARVPLTEAVQAPLAAGTDATNHFENECEGICGV